MKHIDITPDEFALLPPNKQLETMKNLVNDLSKEEVLILKKMIDIEKISNVK